MAEPDSPVPRPPGSRWWWDLKAFDHERLSAAILEFEAENASCLGQPESWSKAAAEQLANAKEFQQKGELAAAWSSLKAARREIVDSLGETELLVEADRLRREADAKAAGWRKAAVSDALSSAWNRVSDAARVRQAVLRAVDSPDYDKGGAVALRQKVMVALAASPPHGTAEELTDLRVRLKEARRVFDENEDNGYRKLQLLRGLLLSASWMLVGVLVFTIVVLFLVESQGWSPSVSATLLADWRSTLVVLALGALGASVSGVLTALRPDADQRIPGARAQRNLVWLRPVVGAGAAMIVVTIIQSGLGGLEIYPEGAFAAALAAGFSERLVGQAVAATTAAIAK